MKIAPLLLMLACGILSLAARADHEKASVPVLNGGILAKGSLVEGPCVLALESTEQDIDLGSVSLAQLRQAGDVTPPVMMELVLDNCPGDVQAIASPSQLRGATWVNQQTAVKMTFSGVAEPTDNHYFRLAGSARGAAIRLEGPGGAQVYPDVIGEPYFLNPGRNSVALKAQLWKTTEPLEPGDFRSTINISLDYE
ncbi:fimbrial protein [Entomohabitans teleogrylli]|uniref:fimbrial protein n=1 Tax=Entomohabitans teleogrylli TaxID=1384589 RepID=UPI00073D53C2|nr:fimbrial protein [Entomohabitans teleogrylli]